MKNPFVTYGIIAFIAISAVALFSFYPDPKPAVGAQYATVKLFIMPWGSMTASTIIKVVDGKSERYAFEKIMKDPTEANYGALYNKLHEELSGLSAKGYTVIAVSEDERGNPQYTLKK